MSTMANGEENIPQWELDDRLGKSLKFADVGTGVMAEYLGVSRNTVGNYTSGRTVPDKRTLMLWAMRTGVPLEWLLTGESPRPDDPDGGTRGPVTVTYSDTLTRRLSGRHLQAVAA